VIRGIGKSSLLFAFGRIPGGPRLYRTLTREILGTQATHVDKLCRVWPDYVEQWIERCGLRIDGADVWIHEGGWTPCPVILNFLITGKGGVQTTSEGRVLDRYLARAVNGVLALDLSCFAAATVRRDRIEALRWANDVREAVSSIDGKLLEGVNPAALPLENDSIDLCHSGGALEHYQPDMLRQFLREAYRILKPGGIMSHVFDHRDHLYHADKGWPFLGHLAIPDLVYRPLMGHRLLYHNRLLPGQVCDLFEEAGFQRITVRRMILPDRRYVDSDAEAASGQPGISRGRLARRFRVATAADLRTAAAHYLYRKS